MFAAPDANSDVTISYYIIEDILSSAWLKTPDLRRLNMSYTVSLGAAADMFAAVGTRQG